MMKNVLITGCSGFLGPFLCDALVLPAEVGGELNISGITEVPGYSWPGMTVYNIDIRYRDKVFEVVEAVRPDVVFHLAAISNVGFSWENQELTYQINFIGSSNLMEALAEFSPRSRVLLMSSAELYGASGDDKMNEAIPISARNP